jgi:hypothetical protein
VSIVASVLPKTTPHGSPTKDNAQSAVPLCMVGLVLIKTECPPEAYTKAYAALPYEFTSNDLIIRCLQSPSCPPSNFLPEITVPFEAYKVTK